MRIYLFMMRTARSISGPREHEESIAANLYEVLREMDEMGVQKMYSESFAGGGTWRGHYESPAESGRTSCDPRIIFMVLSQMPGGMDKGYPDNIYNKGE